MPVCQDCFKKVETPFRRKEPGDGSKMGVPIFADPVAPCLSERVPKIIAQAHAPCGRRARALNTGSAVAACAGSQRGWQLGPAMAPRPRGAGGPCGLSLQAPPAPRAPKAPRATPNKLQPPKSTPTTSDEEDVPLTINDNYAYRLSPTTTSGHPIYLLPLMTWG